MSPYFNQILFTGTNDADHIRNHPYLVIRFSDVGAKLNYNDCHFLMTQVQSIAHIISKEGLFSGLVMLHGTFPAPVLGDVGVLRGLLGLINFYRRFLHILSRLIRPLHFLLVDQKLWELGKDQEEAFPPNRHLVISAPFLVHFNPRCQRALLVTHDPTGLVRSWSTRTLMAKKFPWHSHPDACSVQNRTLVSLTQTR